MRSGRGLGPGFVGPSSRQGRVPAARWFLPGGYEMAMISVLDDLPRLAEPIDHQSSRCRTFQSYRIKRNNRNIEIGTFFIQHELNRAARDGAFVHGHGGSSVTPRWR